MSVTMEEDRAWVLARYPAAAVASLESSGLGGWIATKVGGSETLLAWAPTESLIWAEARRVIVREQGEAIP